MATNCGDCCDPGYCSLGYDDEMHEVEQILDAMIDEAAVSEPADRI